MEGSSGTSQPGTPSPDAGGDGALPLAGDPSRHLVFILEHPEQVPAFSDLYSRLKARWTAIATSPGACRELENRGISYRPVEEYYDADLVFREGMLNYDRVEEICRRIDAHLEKADPVLAEYGLKPGRDNFFTLKLLYDALIIRIQILEGILGKEQPDMVVTFGRGIPAAENGAWEYLPVRYSESLYTRVLALGGWNCRTISLGNQGSTGEGGGKVSPPARAGSFLPRILAKMRRLEPGKIVTHSLNTAGHLIRKGPSVLRVGYAYNWNYISHLIERDGLFVRELSTGRGRRGRMEQRECDIPPDLMGNEGTYHGIWIAPPLAEHAGRVAGEYLGLAGELVPRLRETFRRDPPVAVLFGTKDSAADHIIAHLARHHHIPVVSWQHGAQGIYHAPMMLYYEIMNSDVHLCFGDGVKEMFEKDAREKFGCELRSAGSYELEQLSLDPATSGQEYDILYATTNYYLNYLYIGGIAHSTFQDNELWNTQKRILDLLGESGRSAVLKLHPGQYQETYLREYIREKGYTNITVIRNERSFPDLARHAGLVILDCPSTTLLQAVAAKRPVFTLTKHVQLTGEARAALGGTAFSSGNLDEFITAIRRYLAGEPGPGYPGPADATFLDLYGIHRADGKVADRAIALLRSFQGKVRPGSPPVP